jgi:hypothetical protein
MFRKEALDRLSAVEELDELMHVTTLRSWLALLALGSLLAVAIVWALFATIPTTISGRGALTGGGTSDGTLAATVFVSLDDAWQIQPGMPVKLALSAVKKEQWGLLTGTVTAVDELPASQADMLRVLDNDAFVQTLASAGLLVPVQVQLTPNLNTTSGYQWSSGQGPPMKLRPGMLCQGTIIVNEQRAIKLVFP